MLKGPNYKILYHTVVPKKDFLDNAKNCIKRLIWGLQCPYNDCNAVYIGRIWMNFDVRIKEHLWCLWLIPERTSIALHISCTCHLVDKNNFSQYYTRPAIITNHGETLEAI